MTFQTQLKIFFLVICPFTVLMMHNLILMKRPPNNLLHNNTMFKYLSSINIDDSVTFWVNRSGSTKRPNLPRFPCALNDGCMTDPKVSIVILSYFHPEIIEVCLRTLQITEGVSYEVVVVDNGSDDETREFLLNEQRLRRIDTLVLEPVNHMFSEGNNIGVRMGNPNSEYVLLLNSDVGFMRPDWLTKLVGWAEGTTEHWPSIWPHHPTEPKPGPYDIVSLGWSHDGTLNEDRTKCVRPEGWCCLYRRSTWQDMPQEFPWLYGLDMQITHLVKSGARCGVLSQYGSYLVHREGGSSSGPREVITPNPPDLIGWYDGAHIESLDFTLGPNEHDSYLWW